MSLYGFLLIILKCLNFLELFLAVLKRDIAFSKPAINYETISAKINHF
jgi:hypothetical protein